MSSIDKMHTDGTFNTLSKREKLQITRQRAKLEKNLGSIADLSRLPAALFVVDVMKEKIAINEAAKLNIPVFAMVDTNSDPRVVDFPIPANDDASKSIQLIVRIMTEAIQEGLNERMVEKENTAKPIKDSDDEEEVVAKKRPARKTRARKESIKPKAEEKKKPKVKKRQLKKVKA